MAFWSNLLGSVLFVFVGAESLKAAAAFQLSTAASQLPPKLLRLHSGSPAPQTAPKPAPKTAPKTAPNLLPGLARAAPWPALAGRLGWPARLAGLAGSAGRLGWPARLAVFARLGSSGFWRCPWAHISPEEKYRCVLKIGFPCAKLKRIH